MYSQIPSPSRDYDFRNRQIMGTLRQKLKDFETLFHRQSGIGPFGTGWVFGRLVRIQMGARFRYHALA